MQLSTPESWSVPLNVTGTAWLYQPLTSVPRPAWALVAAGAVASYLSANERAAELPARSRQEAMNAAVAESGPL